MFLHSVNVKKRGTIKALFAARRELPAQHDREWEFCGYLTNVGRRRDLNSRTNPANTDTSFLTRPKVNNVKYTSWILLLSFEMSIDVVYIYRYWIIFCCCEATGGEALLSSPKPPCCCPIFLPLLLLLHPSGMPRAEVQDFSVSYPPQPFLTSAQTALVTCSCLLLVR
jgi:hypothetical protein